MRGKLFCRQFLLKPTVCGVRSQTISFDTISECSAMLPSSYWLDNSAKFAAAQTELGRQAEHPNKSQRTASLRHFATPCTYKEK